MPQAFFFDMDDTLVDSEWASALAVERAVADFGQTLSAADKEAVIGLPWDTIFDNTLRDYAIPLSRAEFKALVLSKKAALLKDGLREVPGAVAAVKRCAARAPVAVVSGSFRFEVQETMRLLGLDELLALVVTNEDCRPGKPDPGPYLLAAQTLGVDPRRCIVFEDSAIGLSAARAAGMLAVEVTALHRAPLPENLAHLRIRDFHEVDEEWFSAVLAASLPEHEV